MSLDTDKVLARFSASCLEAGPTFCALAPMFSFPSDLQAAIIGLMQGIKAIPIQIPGTGSAGTITYGIFKSYLLNQLYSTGQNWIDLAAFLQSAMTGNVTGLIETYSKASSDAGRGSGFASARHHARDQSLTPSVNEALLGIRCAEKTTRTRSLDQVRGPGYLASWSHGYMADFNDYIFATCPQWKFNTKEPYTGNFKVEPAYPVLLVGNTYDPVTPLASAYNVSWGFEGSVVLEHHGHGVSP